VLKYDEEGLRLYIFGLVISLYTSKDDIGPCLYTVKLYGLTGIEITAFFKSLRRSLSYIEKTLKYHAGF
jgi:hypothetical protein